MSNVQRFKAGFGRLPGKSRPFSVRPITRPEPLPAAALDHYWHPGRPGVEAAPLHTQAVLASIHPSLRLVRPPMRAELEKKRHAWLLWFRNPLVTHRLCPGWSLVFIWEDPETHDPLPLDNRLYANCYLRDPRQFQSARAYFEGCVAVIEREREKKKEQFKDHSYWRQKGLRDYQKIKNIGMGNKFALHHDGTLIPARGELNWRTETLYERLPGEVREYAEKEGKNTRHAHSVSEPVGTRAEFAAWQRDVRTQFDLLRLKKEVREMMLVPRGRAMVGSRTRSITP